MNRKKGGVLVPQIVIVLLYLSGMFMNYYILQDFAFREQYGRMKGDINFYISRLYSQWDDVKDGDASLEDIFKDITNSEYYNGTFSILSPDGTIIFNSEGRKGNAFRYFYEDFGEKARDILAKQLRSPDEQGWIEYNDDYSKASFVRYDKDRNVIFFYQYNPKEEVLKNLRIFLMLYIIFLVGGVAIIFLCFTNVRKMSEKLKLEASAKHDLETAAAIQSSMLPKGHRHLMQIDIAAKLVPAQGVGGDLYYYYLKRGRLYFCIGDVSGKGMPASLSMSRAVTLFRSMAEEEMSPSRITSGMNVELCTNNDQNIFVTAIIGVMNVWDGNIRYCNAGHGRPLYWCGRVDSGCRFTGGQGGLPLGFDSSSQYEEYSLELEKNGLLLFFTDGANEARSKKDGMYGFDRLAALADRVKDRSAEEINGALLDDINTFAEGVPQSDDITLLTFRNIPTSKVVEIKNDIRELKKIPLLLDGIFKECPLDDKDRIKVRAGLDEAATNCVLYAYPEGSGTIRISATITSGSLVFTLEDSGVEFNPLEYESSMTGEIKIGGLGIAMTKASFDEMKYARTGGNNVLKLIKNI